MPIVIPTAGRATPQITPQIRDDSTGLAGALAPAARNVAGTLDDIAQQRDAAELNRARLAAAEALGAERQAAEEAVEFDGLADGFDARARTRVSEIATALPGRLQEKFGLAAEEMRIGHMAGVQRRESALRRDYGRTALGQQLTGIAAQAVAAPDETARAGVMSQAVAALEDAVEAKLITPAEFLQKAEELGAETGETLLLRGLREDPAAVVAQLEAGQFASVTGEKRERYITAAKNEIEQRARRAKQQAQVEADRLDRDQEKDAGYAIAILRSGGTVDGLPQLQESLKGTKWGAAVEVAVKAAQTEGGFAHLTPNEQAALLAALKDRPIPQGPAGKVEVAWREELKQIHSTTVSKVNSDPIAFAITSGVTSTPTLRLPDLADPDALNKRISASEAFRKSYGGPIRYFTNAERDALSAEIARLPIDGKLAVATGLAGIGGTHALAALQELGQGDRLWVHAGGLALTGNVGTAQEVLVGAEALKGKDAARPQKPTRDLARAALLADAMAPGSEAHGQRLMEAALAHYAATAAGVDPADRAEQGRALAASIQAVAGQRVVNGVVTGGFQAVNGRQTYLPPGVTAADVEARINLSGRAEPEAFRAGSTGGGLPAGLDGRPYLPRRPVLLAKGGGRYLLAEQRNGRLVRLLDSVTGGDFELDLRKLLEGEAPAGAPAGAFRTTLDALGAAGAALSPGADDESLADRLQRDGK